MNASYVAAIVGVGSALLLAAIARIPLPSDPIVVTKFDEAFDVAPLPLREPPSGMSTEPKPVRVIPIIPTAPVDKPASSGSTTAGKEEPTLEVPSAGVTREVTRRARPTRTTKPTDICRGKGKRYTHNGRSWRCRR